jgi:hypothetical protein
MEKEEDYSNYDYSNNLIIKLRDLEEKQRILKDRILLIGKNLIETKEETNDKIIEIKKDVILLKENIDRLMSFIENISTEFSKFARKEDVEIIAKQIRMFQPLNNKK